jgi:hypothetical protein
LLPASQPLSATQPRPLRPPLPPPIPFLSGSVRPDTSSSTLEAPVQLEIESDAPNPTLPSPPPAQHRDKDETRAVEPALTSEDEVFNNIEDELETVYNSAQEDFPHPTESIFEIDDDDDDDDAFSDFTNHDRDIDNVIPPISSENDTRYESEESVEHGSDNEAEEIEDEAEEAEDEAESKIRTTVG